MTEREIPLPYLAEDDLTRLVYVACAILAGSGATMLVVSLFRAVLV